MDTAAQVASRIIREQQDIIGPIALSEAKKVSGLQITSVDDVQITGDHKEVLGNLVKQYQEFFGKASVEVCKEAFEPFEDKIPASEVPDILKN